MVLDGEDTLWNVSLALAHEYERLLHDYNKCLAKVHEYLQEEISKNDLEDYFLNKNMLLIQELEKSKLICESLTNRLNLLKSYNE